MADDMVARGQQPAAGRPCPPKSSCSLPAKPPPSTNLSSPAVADDIVTRLREMATERSRYSTHYDGCVWQHPLCGLSWALDEVELLRKALALAVGELSTHSQYQAWQPEQLMNQFLDEARNEC